MIIIDNDSMIESSAYQAFGKECEDDPDLDPYVPTSSWKVPYGDWLSKHGGELIFEMNDAGWEIRFANEDDATAFVLKYG